MKSHEVKSGFALAMLMSSLFLGARAGAESGKVLYQASAVVTENADGSITLVAQGFADAIDSDAASKLAAESESRFLARHARGSAAQTWVTLDNATLIATSKAWPEGNDGRYARDTPSGPQPPPPRPGSVDDAIGRVRYYQEQNGYTRNTTYRRSVSRPPHGGFDDGPWTMTRDHTMKTGGDLQP